jgi:hypothetical protein
LKVINAPPSFFFSSFFSNFVSFLLLPSYLNHQPPSPNPPISPLFSLLRPEGLYPHAMAAISFFHEDGATSVQDGCLHRTKGPPNSPTTWCPTRQMFPLITRHRLCMIELVERLEWGGLLGSSRSLADVERDCNV